MKYDIYVSISDNETKRELASLGAVIDTNKPEPLNNNILQLAFMLIDSYVSNHNATWVKVHTT